MTDYTYVVLLCRTILLIMSILMEQLINIIELAFAPFVLMLLSISILVELLHRSFFANLLNCRISVCDSASTAIYHLSEK